jgi:hypothetical protein
MSGSYAFRVQYDGIVTFITDMTATAVYYMVNSAIRPVLKILAGRNRWLSVSREYEKYRLRRT